MPKAVASAFFSLIIVATWSSIYFSTYLHQSSTFIEETDYDVTKSSKMDHDVIYSMDDPNVGSNSTNMTTDSDNESQMYAMTLTRDTGVEAGKYTTVSQLVTESINFGNSEYNVSSPLAIKKGKNETDNLDWMPFKNFTVVEKKNYVKKMMQHAWDTYVKYAWGANELKPLSKQPHYGSVFGRSPTGVTIIDSLDTLYMMGLMEEYNQGRDWVVNNLNVTLLHSEYSVFEVNIRLVGGLLSCYALTGDTVFKEKAQQIADKLLPAFQTPTGIPHSLVEFVFGTSRNYGWASSGSSILSEFGTLHLEFAYLSDVTGNPIYRNRTQHVRTLVYDLPKPNGLYPNYINPNTGNWSQYHSSIGSLGDSFYEYLLKSWLQSNKKDTLARQMYDEAMQAILQQMLQVSRGGLTYFAEKKYDELEHRMEHLGCFIGGLLALGSKSLKNEMSDRYLEVAKEITHTCHETYNRSYTKLGPEAFRFTEDVEARAETASEDHYILRPEVIESYFYLYRLTKDQKYRDWGWEAVIALETYCKTEGGYTGITDVYSENPTQDDVQQSFFMSETLKYLYMLFSDDSVFPLDEWVFNTEAHPLPIKDVNLYYRAVT